jgi:hypothetical protein
MTLRSLIFKLRHHHSCNRTIASARELACEALARDVEKRRSSFEIQDYRKRREAALKRTRGLA